MRTKVAIMMGAVAAMTPEKMDMIKQLTAQGKQPRVLGQVRCSGKHLKSSEYSSRPCAA